jgi:threonine dehydrogenase-like Zn-dependent dehydrogenase
MRATVFHGTNDIEQHLDNLRQKDFLNDAFAAGIGDYRIVTTLCPGGKERMRRLMEVVRHGRVDLTPLLTHRYALDDIVGAYQLFGERRENVVKVAITP